MDEIRSLLGDQPCEGTDVLSANLKPRHRELIPTPCGPIRPWCELSPLEKLYLCSALVSLLVLLGLTLSSVYAQVSAADAWGDDLAVSLIQAVGILFCVYYVCRGVLQENRLELVAFGLSVLAVVIRSVVNYSVVPDKRQLLVRFACVLTLGSVTIVCTVLLVLRPNRMAFRVGGALESLQDQYSLLNLCFSMVTFDLQAQLCLCFLILTWGTATSLSNLLFLMFGVIWACATAAVGGVAVLKEAKNLILVFVLQNIVQVVFFTYLMYTVIVKLSQDDTYTLEAAAITGGLMSVGIKAVLFWSLLRLVRSFGHGLRERRLSSDK